MEEIKLVASDGLELAVTVFQSKEKNTKALIQIIHGATEHKERYYEFSNYLSEQGYTVIVSDTRGHGASVSEAYPLGYMDGFHEVIDDQFEVTQYIKKKYPEKELYLFGHSLGSLFARIYLQKYDSKIEKLILSGTVNYNPAVHVGILLGRLITTIKGKSGTSRILNWLSNNRKDDSWISASQTNLEKYRNDPLCQYSYLNSSTLTMFRADRELRKYKQYECKNPTLRILSVSGAGDPVTGGKQGLKKSIDSLKRIGYKHISNIVYPGMKHEVLNEHDKALVYKDITKFLLE